MSAWWILVDIYLLGLVVNALHGFSSRVRNKVREEMLERDSDEWFDDAYPLAVIFRSVLWPIVLIMGEL